MRRLHWVSFKACVPYATLKKEDPLGWTQLPRMKTPSSQMVGIAQYKTLLFLSSTARKRFILLWTHLFPSWQLCTKEYNCLAVDNPFARLLLDTERAWSVRNLRRTRQLYNEFHFTDINETNTDVKSLNFVDNFTRSLIGSRSLLVKTGMYVYFLRSR